MNNCSCFVLQLFLVLKIIINFERFNSPRCSSHEQGKPKVSDKGKVEVKDCQTIMEFEAVAHETFGNIISRNFAAKRSSNNYLMEGDLPKNFGVDFTTR